MAGPVRGDRLRALRKEREKQRGRRLTHVEVADAVGAERSHYSHMEGGRAQPSVQVLAAIADYYGVSTDYLLGRSDIREVQQQADLVESQYEWASKARLRQLPEEDRGFLKDMYLSLLRRRGIDPAAEPPAPSPTTTSPGRKPKNNPAA